MAHDATNLITGSLSIYAHVGSIALALALIIAFRLAGLCANGSFGKEEGSGKNEDSLCWLETSPWMCLI